MNDSYDLFIAGLGALSRLVVLSIILERGLAFVFEHDWFRALFTRKVPTPGDPAQEIRESKIPGLRGTLALVASIWICSLYSFDVLSVIFNRPPGSIGIIVTGVVAAGGSAGAIAVFQGFLSFGRDSREALIAAKKADAQSAADVAKLETEAKKSAAEAAKAEADARKLQAEAAAARAALDKKNLLHELPATPA